MPMVVNGEIVDDEVISNEAAGIKERLRAEMGGEDELSVELRAREWARENAIERILLRQAAAQDPNPVPAEAIAAAMDRLQVHSPQQARCMQPHDQEVLRSRIELDLRMERLLGTITAEVPRPKSKDVAARYQQRKASFQEPELVRAAHIVKNVDEATSEQDAETAIRAIQLELQEGGNFEEIADRCSDCPGRGGDLGSFPRGQMVQEFEDIVFALQPGESSGVFRSPFGFHIAKVIERTPGRVKSLNEVRQEIETALWNERKQEALGRFVTSLRAKADIRRVSAPKQSPAV